MKHLIGPLLVIAAITLLGVGCQDNPGDGSKYYLIQKVFTGHRYKAEKSAQQIRYTGMPSKDSISFAGPTPQYSSTVYFPVNAKEVNIAGCRFKIHEVSPEMIIMEWTGGSKEYTCGGQPRR